jgi:hypothetical protein
MHHQHRTNLGVRPARRGGQFTTGMREARPLRGSTSWAQHTSGTHLPSKARPGARRTRQGGPRKPGVREVANSKCSTGEAKAPHKPGSSAHPPGWPIMTGVWEAWLVRVAPHGRSKSTAQTWEFGAPTRVANHDRCVGGVARKGSASRAQHLIS